MKYITIYFAIVVKLFQPSWMISMEEPRKKAMFSMCYSNERSNRRSPFILGQTNYPLASSVENLIALIEKIENASRIEILPKELAINILKLYRSDGNSVVGRGLQQDDLFEKIDLVENQILDQTNELEDNYHRLIDRMLTDNEKCSLYFMLSYNINYTQEYRSYGSRNHDSESGRYSYRSQGMGLSRGRDTGPREYGIGSFRNDKHQGIALTLLILGIIAGLTEQHRLSVRDILNNISNKPGIDYLIKLDGQLDPLAAVTISCLYALSAHPTNRFKEIGVAGEWNSVTCPTKYTLKNTSISDATMASLKGALDGYHLGMLTRELVRQPFNRIRLSQILKLYYDPIGCTSLGRGYCKRFGSNLDYALIKETATDYLRVLMANKRSSIEDAEVTDYIRDIELQFHAALKEAGKIPLEDQNWCTDNSIELETQNKPCETPSDVFIVADLTDQEYFERQKETIANLVHLLDLGSFGSSLTILTLNDDHDNIEFQNNLKHITWDDFNKGCPSCALMYLNRDYLGSQVIAPSSDFYNKVNDTLRDFENRKRLEYGVPAKPFIIFGNNFQTRNADYNMQIHKRALQEMHRDVPLVIVTTKSIDELEEFIQDPDDMIRDTGSVANLAHSLKKRICETPATFQHPNCFIRTSTETDPIYEGFITRGHKQHWAVYPEYFLKSFRITLKFIGVGGGIRVCFSRQKKPEEHGLCYEEAKDKEIIFEVTNPCQYRSLLNCDPFYFTITALDEGTTNNNLCLDKRCLNLNQIKFRFYHAGMQCNESIVITPSLITPLIAILTILLFFFKLSTF